MASNLVTAEYVGRGLELWRIYAEDYRTMLIRYRFLIEQKRRLKTKSEKLGAVPKAVLEEFPGVPLFRLTSEDEAREMLELMPHGRLVATVRAAEAATDSYAFRTVKTRTIELEYWLRTRDGHGRCFAVNADRLSPRIYANGGGYAARELVAYNG